MRTLIKKTLKFFFPYFPNGIRVKILRLCGYVVGKKVYISPDLKISDLGISKKNLIIGDRVSIGPGVIIVTDSSSNNSKLTRIYPINSGVVILEDDCWLSAGVIILPNVKVGVCSIIAAGAVVIEDIPPFSVFGGIPAKKIKSLLKSDFQ
jgi:acetyltransferase-like isoleucine patch superfamily enzyme